MKALEISGHWWVADHEDRSVAGTLRFDGDGLPELDLMGTLTDDAESIAGAVVLGRSGTAEPVTVQVAFETNRGVSSSRLGGHSVRQRVGTNFAFVGAHLPTATDRQFRQITISYTDLFAWTGWRGPIHDDDGGDTLVRFTPPEELVATVPWGTVRLRASRAVGGSDPAELKISVGAGFHCERDTPVAVETWLNEVVGPLRDFVSLMTDRANQVEEVTLQWAETEPYVRLLYSPTAVELPGRTAYWFEFPSAATGIGAHFEYAVNRWLQLQVALGPALDLYFSTQYRKSMHLENRFLNVAGAAEAYHRRTVPLDASALAKHLARLDRVLATADKADQKWVRGRLRHAYEPTFEDRVTALGTRATLLLEPWIGPARPFAKRVADARNLLVHQDPGATTERPSGRDLYALLEDLSLVFLVCLFQDLGFSDVEIGEMFRRTRRWRELDFRTKGWRD